AGDVASVFSSAGLRTRLFIGIPAAGVVAECDVSVISLKIRSVAQDLAASQALSALDWLEGQGAAQIMYKYCSTFDSTPKGNIGPVLDVLSKKMGAHR